MTLFVTDSAIFNVIHNTKLIEAWWCHGNTFASHRYGPGSTLGCMWDVFHPLQIMLGGFLLIVFFHPQKGLKLFHLEPSQ